MCDSKTYDTSKVSTIFLLAGGNDVSNLKKDSGIEKICEGYEDVVDLLAFVFPNAKVNIFSLIPRESRYRSHIKNMHDVNSWLDRFCQKYAGFRFVDIFSFFLTKTPSKWVLNQKLFTNSKAYGRVHFTRIGYSVLAKVLLAVANRPRNI